MSTIYFTENPDRKRFAASLFSRLKNNIEGKVLIKVNLVSHNPYPTTTHPEMIEAVYDQIKSKASDTSTSNTNSWPSGVISPLKTTSSLHLTTSSLTP